jgi:hypothetical protein
MIANSDSHLIRIPKKAIPFTLTENPVWFDAVFDGSSPANRVADGVEVAMRIPKRSI